MQVKLFQKIWSLIGSGKLGSKRRHSFAVWGKKLGKLPPVYGPPILLTSLLVTGILWEFKQLGKLQFLELQAFDQMVRLRSAQVVDPRLLVIGVTEADIQQQQRWPLSDLVLAQLLRQLQQYQPKVIGLDIYRDVPHSPGSADLREQLQADNIIVIEELGSTQIVPPPPNVPPERVGFNDLVIDPDNVLRRNLMYVQSPSGSKKAYSFALQVSLHYLAERNLVLQVEPDALRLGSALFKRLQANSGSYQLPQSEARGWQTLIDYRSQRVAKQVSLTEVLEGKIDPSWVKDKIVLIGIVAPSSKDMFPSPYSSMQTTDFEIPGVVAHAYLVSQILSSVLDGQPQFWFSPQWGEWFWLWGWSLVGGLLVWRSNHPLSLGLALAVAVGGLWGICYLLFTQAGWMPFVSPLLTLLASSGSILACKLLYTQSYDPLTGLPNRRLLTKQLQRASQQHNSGRSPAFSEGAPASCGVNGLALEERRRLTDPCGIALIYLDLNNYNLVKNSLGYQAGEQLLLGAAKRLQACLHAQDRLARIVGSEFAIYLRPNGNLDQVTQIAKQLQRRLSLPFTVNGQEIFTTVSMGIAFNQAGQHFEPEDLLRNATLAMHRARALGKLTPEVFALDLHTQSQMRLHLESDLRQALQRQEFQLHYQPLVSLTTGRIVGFEALVRWQSQGRGCVSPGNFIPLAEETGLIVPLGRWILQQACCQLSCWQQQFPQHPALSMSVNLSARQLTQPDLFEQLQSALNAVELKPNTLKLEITESSLIDDGEAVLSLLWRLKELGVSLSLDDFGTGYSSLSYLHRFPIDYLKVDRSFVSSIENGASNAAIAEGAPLAIARAIVNLGHNLGMEVIAEGIETQGQLKALQALQCEYGQGYLFSPPLPREAAADLLANSPQWLTPVLNPVE